MDEWCDVRAGAYHDSISLMRVSRALARESGITDAMVAMATEPNRELVTRMGFTVPNGAGSGDLLVAVRGEQQAVAAARDDLDRRLADTATGGGTTPAPGTAPRAAPRTTASAARAAGGELGRDATLALISVPGAHAFVEAADALDAGLDVMIFSDNVPVEQEIALKETAARRGLLVLGPDCGTAVIGGAGLGFANATRPGPVGLVAASGTGAQQVTCLLAQAGCGISHVLGVGGRDLSERVGGASTTTALDALDADPATELIVLVSKPPAPRVARAVEAHVERLRTPVVFALLGADGTGADGVDLTRASERALRAVGADPPDWPVWPARPDWQGATPPEPCPGALRGLFSGGTLAEEAMLIATATLGEVRSNIPLYPAWALDDTLTAPGHLVIDFGDDRLTRGRAHPMIDPDLRLARLAAEAADPRCAVLLLDVVLGHGADPDPAGTLAPAITAARARAAADGRGLAVVVSLCGTRDDPQDRDATAAALADTGATVFASNAQAARYAAGLLHVEVR